MDYDLSGLKKLPVKLDKASAVIHAFPSCELATDFSGLLGIKIGGRIFVERVFVHADWVGEENDDFLFDAIPLGNGVQFRCLHAAEPIVVEVEAAESGPGIRLTTRIATSIDREVRRDALILRFAAPIREAYLPNGRELAAPNSGQAWIGAGTVVFADDRFGASVQGPDRFSSLEIDPDSRELWINLEYRYDHPFIAPPKGDLTWDDVSAERHVAGESRAGGFRLDILAADRPVARPMLAPGGAQSVFVWTEHACNCVRDIHPAVYFGHQDIEDPGKAVGGFAKHRIPVTKSVFFCNPTNAVNSVHGPGHGEPMLSIDRSDSFLRFLTSLRDCGDFEIVPHSVSPATTSRREFEEGARFMRDAFHPRTWIDHCVFKGHELRGGHDNFLAHGLEPGSPHYRRDLWERYGYKYFWNHAHEYFNAIPQGIGKPRRAGVPRVLSHLADYATHKAGKLLSILGMARRMLPSGGGRSERQNADDDLSLDHFSRPRRWPSPLWWRNKSKSGDLVSWGTRLPSTSNFRADTCAEIRRQLESLVDSWGVCLYHAYPARADADNAAWTVDPSGKYVVSGEFDGFLARMGELRDSGLLHLGTVGDIMAHWTALENISWAPESDRRYRVVNRNAFEVRGVAFGVKRCAASVGGTRLSGRSVGADRVYRIDLQAQSSVVVDLTPGD